MNKRDRKNRVARKDYRERWARAFEMRGAGAPVREIAAKLEVTVQAVYYIWSKREPEPYTKICALLECDVEFTTRFSTQLYCCHVHSKRGSERSRLGKNVGWMSCRLPECEKVILRVGNGVTAKRFCCKTHTSRHLNRIEIGYYGRLIERTSCFVCGFWGPGLDRHHLIRRTDGGSDDPSNLVWLCSNHHRMLHSNLAHFEDGLFVDDREEMLASELLSREDWGE